MKIKIKTENKIAFTLIEMIVSLSVIMFVSTIFIANYNSNNRRTDLIMTAQGLVADLHASQSKSLGLVKYGQLTPAGGWGINFNKTAGSYTVFADLNQPGTSGYLKMDAQTEANRNFGAREIKFSKQVIIDRLIFFDGSTEIETNELNITFLPPDPTTNIFNVQTQATGTAAVIELKDIGSDKNKKVRVNFLGLIEVIE